MNPEDFAPAGPELIVPADNNKSREANHDRKTRKYQPFPGSSGIGPDHQLVANTNPEIPYVEPNRRAHIGRTAYMEILANSQRS